MKLKEKNLDLQDIEIPALEKDCEGKLRGGFSVIKTNSNDGDGWKVKFLCNCGCLGDGEETPTPPVDEKDPPTDPTDDGETPTYAFGGTLGSSLVF